MNLVRLIYASAVVSDGDKNIVNSIMQAATKNNSKNDITGLLALNGDFFLQALEGSRAKVNELFIKITRDKRHKDIMIIEYGEIFEREFSEWNMTYVPITEKYKNIILKHGTESNFSPYNIYGKSALSLLVKLKQFAEK